MSVYPQNFSDKPERLELLESTDGHCWYCGCALHKEMIAEHQTPTFLVPSCRSCNSQKRSRNLEEYRAYVMRVRAGIPYFNGAQLAFLRNTGYRFPESERVTFFGEML